jgi:hypothetical protein
MIGQTNEAWAMDQVRALPARWSARLLTKWEKRRTSFNPQKLTSEGAAQRAANVELREWVARLLPLAVSSDLPLDADDGTVKDYAAACAERCRVALLELTARQLADAELAECIAAAGSSLDAAHAMEQRATLAAITQARGITAPDEKKYEDVPAVRRMIAPRWWTLQTRKAHARAVESAAIALGIVNKSRDCYVSNEGLEARRAQNKRNADLLEATRAINVDTEQEFTLAQLAAKGTANKAVRRAELMTRISGFERIAIAAGHTGLFLTITCPSKMHRHRMIGGRAQANPKYENILPNDAQKYLTKIWARIRAALARAQCGVYGFRIAEPQHDGTPHWHLLLFYPAANDAKIRSTITRYALEMDGDEEGAAQKRCDFKTMDPAVGTAAAYIAKYVAKNIDGYRLEKDLLGNDALETSARVEAWATRWRIRQFQQVGGPPVTVWRELRRVEAVPADAPKHVIAAHNAVNKVATFEGRENASVAWDHYVKAQGGVFCGRNYRVRLSTVASDKRNAYGEECAAVPVGIEYREAYKVRDAIGNWIDVKPMTTIVESKRYEWKILRPGAHTMPRAVGLEVGLKRAQRAPRTCVNNCTEQGENGGFGQAESGKNRSGGAPRTDREAIRARKNDGREVFRPGRAPH